MEESSSVEDVIFLCQPTKMILIVPIFFLFGGAFSSGGDENWKNGRGCLGPPPFQYIGNGVSRMGAGSWGPPPMMPYDRLPISPSTPPPYPITPPPPASPRSRPYYPIPPPPNFIPPQYHPQLYCRFPLPPPPFYTRNPQHEKPTPKPHQDHKKTEEVEHFVKEIHAPDEGDVKRKHERSIIHSNLPPVHNFKENRDPSLRPYNIPPCCW